MAAMRRAIDLEQLVEVLGVLGEEVAVALHEAVEVGLPAGGALLEHLVELGEHVLGALHLPRGHGFAHGPGHLVEPALGELLAQLVDELLELLPRLARRELVLLQLAHQAGQVGREEVELHLSFGHGFVGDLLAALVAGLGRLAREVVERLALHVDDVAQLLGDVVVDAAEVVLLEAVAPVAAQPLEHLPHALDLLAVAVLGSRSASAGAGPR